MRQIVTLLTSFSLILFLAACESSEERAEQHYQNALALIEEGDNDRAIVELRNVFQLNGSHQEARHVLAELLLNHQNNRQAAYSQYLRLVEQYPDDLEARIALSRIAFQATNWEELERHGAMAAELAPEDDRVQIITIVRDYRAASVADDEAARNNSAQMARDRIGQFPEDILLREVLIDNHLRNREFREALAELDIATEIDPENMRFWQQRLQVLIQLGDEDAAEAQLVDLVERFPEDAEQKAILVRYYLSRNRLDDTEAFLRKLVDEAGSEDAGARIDLIRFLTEVRGAEVAMQEIDTAIAESEDPIPFIVLGAGMDFTTGNQDAAIASLEEILDTAEPSTQTDNVKTTLAKMLLATGNDVGARALVEEVLAENPNQVQALKMNARWLIDGDDADNAISALRLALDSNPDDAEALTLMAEAYSRTGSNDLARDFMSLAVEASGNAPAETTRYVRLLISEERYLPAEDTLLAALRLAPQNLDLLRLAGDLYLAMEDLGRTEQVVDTLKRIGTPEADQIAVQIETQRLSQEGGIDEALNYLEGLANSADASFASRVMLVRARLAAGEADEALAIANEILEENPDAPGAKLIVATTASATGDYERTAEIYRDVVTDFPSETRVWLELSRTKMRQGLPEEGRAVVNEGLELNPGAPNLLWASASYLEGDGDIDGAIEIYEELYAQDTSSVIVANNLASLISTYRADEANLERAWNIARRFRDLEIPAIQDTYGWIVHLRGNSEEAVDYLEPAAAGLPNDALVQFHLGEALFALDRKEEAAAQYRKVLDLAGATDTREQIGIARERLAAIEDAPESE